VVADGSVVVVGGRVVAGGGRVLVAQSLEVQVVTAVVVVPAAVVVVVVVGGGLAVVAGTTVADVVDGRCTVVVVVAGRATVVDGSATVVEGSATEVGGGGAGSDGRFATPTNALPAWPRYTHETVTVGVGQVVGHSTVTGKAAAASRGVPASQIGPPAAVTCQSVPDGSPLPL